MFSTLIQNFRQRRLVQRSMGQMLSRADAPLLDDIGLTRQDLEVLIHRTRAESIQHRMPVALRAGVLLRAPDRCASRPRAGKLLPFSVALKAPLPPAQATI